MAVSIGGAAGIPSSAPRCKPPQKPHPLSFNHFGSYLSYLYSLRGYPYNLNSLEFSHLLPVRYKNRSILSPINNLHLLCFSRILLTTCFYWPWSHYHYYFLFIFIFIYLFLILTQWYIFIDLRRTDRQTETVRKRERHWSERDFDHLLSVGILARYWTCSLSVCGMTL